MFKTLFVLMIFMGNNINTELKFDTKETCEEFRSQIVKPHVAFKAKCVEMKVKKKSFHCTTIATTSVDTDGSNIYVNTFPVIDKFNCVEN